MHEKIMAEIKASPFYQNNFPNDGQRFVAWYLRRILLLDEEATRAAITDGAGDKQIDAIIVEDGEDRRIRVIQGKFVKPELIDAQPLQEVLSAWTRLKDLPQLQVECSGKLAERLEAARVALEDEYEVQFELLTTGSLTPAALQQVTAFDGWVVLINDKQPVIPCEAVEVLGKKVIKPMAGAKPKILEPEDLAKLDVDPIPFATNIWFAVLGWDHLHGIVPACSDETMFKTRKTIRPDNSKDVGHVVFPVGLALGSQCALAGVLNVTHPIAPTPSGTVGPAVAGQVAFFSAPTAVVGDPGLTYDPATDILSVGTAILNGQGSAASPSYSFTVEPGTGLFRQAAGALGFSVLGVERLRIASDQVLHRDGTAALPSISFFNATDSGFFKTGDADAEISVALEGGIRFQFRRLIGIDAFFGGDGNASLPGYTFVADGDTGMFRAGANLIGFATAGVERVRITTAQVQSVPGAAATPAYSFLLDPDTGIFNSGANEIAFAASGVLRARITATPQLLGSDGTALAPFFSFDLDTNTGIFRQGADAVGFSTGGVERARLTTAQLLQSDGSAAAPFLGYLADADTGIFRVGADVLGFSCGGVNVVQILNASGVRRITPQEGLELLADTPATLAFGVGNYSPGNRIVSRVSASVALIIHGVVATGAVPLMRVFTNVGAFNITLANESGLASASNRFHWSTGADIILGPDDSIIFWYDPTTLRWRDFSFRT